MWSLVNVISALKGARFCIDVGSLRGCFESSPTLPCHAVEFLADTRMRLDDTVHGVAVVFVEGFVRPATASDVLRQRARRTTIRRRPSDRQSPARSPNTQSQVISRRLYSQTHVCGVS